MSSLLAYERAHDITGQPLSATSRRPDHESWTSVVKFTTPHTLIDQGFLVIGGSYNPARMLIGCNARWSVADRHSGQPGEPVLRDVTSAQIDRLFRDENIFRVRYLPDALVWIARLAAAQPYVLVTLDHLRSPMTEDFGAEIAAEHGLSALLEATSTPGTKRCAEEMLAGGADASGLFLRCFALGRSHSARGLWQIPLSALVTHIWTTCVKKMSVCLRGDC